MRLCKRLQLLENRQPAANLMVTLSDSGRALKDVEAEYNAKHGFDPARLWLHVRFVGIDPELGRD